MDLIAHPTTEKNIHSFITYPSHGLLIVGAYGSGKTHVAKYIASSILKKSARELENYPYFWSLAPLEGNRLGIDDIREIKKFLQLKTTGSSELRRFVVISDAHALGHEAQNAMLKLLEEPPKDTCLILTTSNPDKLKPTILSRLQTLRVRNIFKSQLKDLLSDQSKTERLYALSEGAVAELMRLKDGGESNESEKYLHDAKDLIIDSRQNRLVKINKLVKADSYDFGLLLDGLYKIIDMKLKLISKKQNDKNNAKVLYLKLKQIQHARKMLSQNVQPKLVLTKLFYEM